MITLEKNEQVDLPEIKTQESKKPNLYSGLAFCTLFALLSYFVCKADFFVKYNINSLTFAIITGMVIGNTLNKFIPETFKEGITFSGKRILRFAIILYGFRITFAQIAGVGLSGFAADIIMLSSTYLIGYYLGTRVFKLDKDLCMLTAIGSSICGAAAVLGTDSVLKAKAHKVSLAVATVVLFGTLAMLLYPFIYKLGFLNADAFGIYIGSTVHEVAQVVAAGSAVSKPVMDTAVIVKLTRVMMLVPYLFLLSMYLAKKSGTKMSKIQIPWFAILFIVVCGINSTGFIPEIFVLNIVEFDIFLLTLAMFALGVETNFKKIKGLGIKPLLLALIMFIWLVFAGFMVAEFISL